MYIDYEEYHYSIENYRKNFTQFVNEERLLVNYWNELFKEGYSARSLKHEDYYPDVNHGGATKVDIISSLSAGIIMRIYGNFEYHIILLCEVVQRSLEIGISHQLISGSGIFKAIKYLNNLMNFDYKKNHKELYEKVESWNRVRNILVHNNASSDKDDDFKHYFNIGINFDHEINAVVTDIDDCVNLINTLEEFSNKLFDILLTIVKNEEDMEEDYNEDEEEN